MATGSLGAKPRAPGTSISLISLVPGSFSDPTLLRQSGVGVKREENGPGTGQGNWDIVWIDDLKYVKLGEDKGQKDTINIPGSPLTAEWLGLCTFTAEGLGSILGQGTKTPQATGLGKKIPFPSRFPINTNTHPGI